MTTHLQLGGGLFTIAVFLCMVLYITLTIKRHNPHIFRSPRMTSSGVVVKWLNLSLLQEIVLRSALYSGGVFSIINMMSYLLFKEWIFGPPLVLEGILVFVVVSGLFYLAKEVQGYAKRKCEERPVRDVKTTD